MCYNGKCLHCLEVETGTLIFAIIQMIFTSIGAMATLAVVIYFNMDMQYMVADTNYSPYRKNHVFFINVMSNVLFVVALALISLALVFSVVLLIGVCQSKAGYVKAYFIYGLLNLLGMIIYGLIGLIGNFDARALCIFIGIWTIDGLLLHMIRMTYKKFQGGDVEKV